MRTAEIARKDKGDVLTRLDIMTSHKVCLWKDLRRIWYHIINLSDSRIDFRFSHLSITLIMEKWNLGTGKFIFSNTLIKTRVLGVFSR